MPYVERLGYRIHYQSHGREGAPPLLLVMGLAMASDAWESLPVALSERFHVLVLDNRGVGRSTLGVGRFLIRDLADDAAEVLDAARVGPASVFGISMGGMISQELAIRHPERVRSLVLGATFGSHRRSHKPSPLVAKDLFLVAILARSGRAMARLLVSDEFLAGNRERFERWIGGLSRADRKVARRQNPGHRPARGGGGFAVAARPHTAHQRGSGSARSGGELAPAVTDHPAGPAGGAPRGRSCLPVRTAPGDHPCRHRALPRIGRRLGGKGTPSSSRRGSPNPPAARSPVSGGGSGSSTRRGSRRG